MSIRRVLIAVDEQPVSVRAAEVGADLARSLGGEIALVHVSEHGYPGDIGISPTELMAQAKPDSKRLLAGFRERLSLPVSTLEFAQTGTPAAVIVGTAKEWSADLIVIASHARDGVARALLQRCRRRDAQSTLSRAGGSRANLSGFADEVIE